MRSLNRPKPEVSVERRGDGTLILSSPRALPENLPLMIDLLGRQHGMPAVDAYLLCSVCGDLRISEIVDIPNWTVSFYFPRVVFD